jgi:mRNA interferase RelE/StbE
LTRTYRVTLTDRAERDLAAIDPPQQQRIVKALRRLAAEPRRDPQVRRLSGRDEYRLRVGDYRVLFEIEDDQLVVLVVEIGHRRGVYR